jgi:hypothetical protein
MEQARVQLRARRQRAEHSDLECRQHALQESGWRSDVTLKSHGHTRTDGNTRQLTGLRCCVL